MASSLKFKEKFSHSFYNISDLESTLTFCHASTTGTTKFVTSIFAEKNGLKLYI